MRAWAWWDGAKFTHVTEALEDIKSATKGLREGGIVQVTVEMTCEGCGVVITNTDGICEDCQAELG